MHKVLELHPENAIVFSLVLQYLHHPFVHVLRLI